MFNCSSQTSNLCKTLDEIIIGRFRARMQWVSCPFECLALEFSAAVYIVSRLYMVYNVVSFQLFLWYLPYVNTSIYRSNVQSDISVSPPVVPYKVLKSDQKLLLEVEPLCFLFILLNYSKLLLRSHICIVPTDY